ncbi:tigger transposable element-derived protein 4-like [Saccostrea cucullata]|uniref:tigger transposable element-derived protein 4-like n=1 Tax=Saccostrea cuccullata TaxID=36930 RepID=UPI002ED5EEDB
MSQHKPDKQSNEGPGLKPGGIVGLSGGVKRKLKVHSIETKFQAITEVERSQLSKAEIAKKYEVPHNTLSTWLKNAEKIKLAYEESSFGPQRKKMRKATYENTEQAVLQWFKAARDKNIPVSGPLLMAKSEEFATQLGDTEFKYSMGWLDRFKERHAITFKRVCGESNSVNEKSTAMTEWSSNLKTLLDKYNPSDIYNADETGLFFRLLPDKTLEFKGVDCHGGKSSKDRLTMTENTSDLLPALQKIQQRITAEELKSADRRQSCITNFFQDCVAERDIH